MKQVNNFIGKQLFLGKNVFLEYLANQRSQDL
jgi:hypothetical protein